MLDTPPRFHLTEAEHSSRLNNIFVPPEIVPAQTIPLHGVLPAIAAADLLGIIAIGAVGFDLVAGPPLLGMAPLWGCLGLALLVWGLSAHLHVLYGRQTLSGGMRRLLLAATATWAQSFGLVLLAAFALRLSTDVSRIWLIDWTAASIFWVVAVRVAWRAYLSRALARGSCFERVLVLANSTDAAARAGRRLECESARHLCAVAAAALPGLPGAPDCAWVESAVRDGLVDRIVIAHFAAAMEQTNALLRRLARVAIDVTLLPDLDGLHAPVMQVGRIGGLAAFDLDFHPLTPFQAAVKRAEDLLLGSLFMLAFLPLLLIVAVAVKLNSPGPVFFRQVRVGFNGRPFHVWKFRTMHAHARDDDAVRQTSRQDCRVTRIGRFLRRSSIDELPQLFNVLAGNMSIVGPRPHARGMTAVGLPLHDVVAEYSARHRLKPGITGWAQVNGCRGEVDSHDKLRRRVTLDFYYIENWSLALDLWIVLRTVALMATDKNAY